MFLGAEMRRGHSLFTESVFLKAPCCTLCGVRLHASRITRAIVPILIVAGAWVLYYQLRTHVRFAGPIAFAAGLVGFIGFAGLDVEHPAPFGVTPAGDRVTYSFRDPSLGLEFKALNHGTIEAGGLTSA